MKQNKYLESEIKKSFDHKIKVFSNGRIYDRHYKKKFSYIPSNFEVSNDSFMHDKFLQNKKGRVSSSNSDLKEIRVDSISRTRNALIDYAIENEYYWKSFITLTFAENITDIDFANKCFHKWVSSVRRVYADFAYLGVPEFQKRGAVHYHLLTNLVPGSELCPFQSESYALKQYDVKYWTYGFSSVFDVVNSTDTNFNVALYICKYLYKDIENRLFGRNKILKSNNLKKPNVIKLLECSASYRNAISYIKEKNGQVINDFEFDPLKLQNSNSFVIGFNQIEYLSDCNTDEFIYIANS